MRRWMSTVSFVVSYGIAAACTSPQAQPTEPELIVLTPYLTSTAHPSSTPGELVAADTPLPSPTPFAYTVQRGDTMSGIALRFGISIDDLQAANPEIPPNAMSVGQVLQIPGSSEDPSGVATPTPAPFTVQQLVCHPTADRGMWCFVLARNDSFELMENLSAQVTLIGPDGIILASQIAFLPLNILPPGSSIPLTVFFPPQIRFDARPRVRVLTAIKLLPGDERYLTATIQNTIVQVDAGGRTARVAGQVLLPEASPAAGQVWVAATAYDEGGRVVGVRRWDSDARLPSGGALPFEFMVSSLGGRIADVEFAVEARP